MKWGLEPLTALSRQHPSTFVFHVLQLSSVWAGRAQFVDIVPSKVRAFRSGSRSHHLAFCQKASVSHYAFSAVILYTLPSVQQYSTPCLQCKNPQHPAFSAKILNTLPSVQKYSTPCLQCKNPQHIVLSAVIQYTLPSVQQYSTPYLQCKNTQHIVLSAVILDTLPSV